MYKVSVVSLGCPKNQVDAECILAYLKNGGFEITPAEAEADAIIINTCGFIADAKAEAIENILECAQYKNEGVLKALIVTGCLAERYKDDITKEIPEVDLVVGIGSNKDIARLTKEAIEGKAQNSYGEKCELDLNAERMLGGLPFTSYIKIAEGCDNCCTYCAIPNIRGRFRSRRMEDIIAEAKSLAVKGTTELIVVAQDTTAYGTDLYGESMLPKLLEELSKIESIHWIRTLYTYPEKITDELVEVIANNKKLVKYLDIPIQHADGEILKRMNRKGNKESLIKTINNIREKVEGITLRTTLITGFPGETDEQFTTLHEFVKDMRFDRLGCFAYSEEEDTPAASFENPVPEQTRQDRMELIMADQMTIAEEKNREKIGKVAEVLIEGWDDYIKCYFGRSEWDAPEIDGKVFFTSNEPLILGDYQYVLINDCLEYDLLGEKIDEPTE